MLSHRLPLRGSLGVAAAAAALVLPTAAHASAFAVVNADGTAARGGELLSSSKVGPGLYQIAFSRTVRGCAFLVTPGFPNATPLNQQVFAGATNGQFSSNTVLVAFTRTGS